MTIHVKIMTLLRKKFISQKDVNDKQQNETREIYLFKLVSRDSITTKKYYPESSVTPKSSTPKQRKPYAKKRPCLRVYYLMMMQISHIYHF